MRFSIRHGVVAFSAAFLLPGALHGQTVARYGHSSSLLPNGNVIVIGGESSPGTFVAAANAIELSVPSSDAQFVLGVPTGCTTSLVRSSHTATVLPNGKVLVVGGATTGPAVINSPILYNPNTNQCEATGNAMQSARIHHTATLLANGKVLIVGGDNDLNPGNGVLTTVDLYDPVTNLFTPADNMLASRAGHTATILYNNLVFVAGGYSSATNFLANTELFDLSASGGSQWQPGPVLVRSRAFHTATLLGNGNIMLIGGFNGFDFLDNRGYLETAEIYNPFDNALMAPPAPMSARRIFHTAVLQPSGSVLVTGGLGNITTSYATGGYSFNNGSIIQLGTGGSNAVNEGVIQVTSNLTFPINWTLAKAVSGEIINGVAAYSVRTLTTLADGTVYFTQPGNFSQLDGMSVDGGVLTTNAITLLPPVGRVTFPLKTAAISDTDVNDVPDNIHVSYSGTTTCPAGPNRNCDIGFGSSVNLDVNMSFDASEDGATILQATATLKSGTITKNGGGVNYTVTFTSASSVNIAGGNIADDGTGSVRYTKNGVTFSNLAGQIRNDSDQALADAQIDLANANITGIQVAIAYTVSRVKVDGVAFTTDVTTITIASMNLRRDESYNPKTDTWTLGPKSGHLRMNHSALLNPNGTALFYGGRACDGASCSSLTGPGATFPTLSAWAAEGTLNTGRSNLTLTNLPNGKVLAAGGGSPNPVAAAELYDPVTKAWTVTGSMGAPRSNHTATLLPDGNVLVAGGFISSASTGATSGAEIYYPETGKWVPTGPMVSSRQVHTATLLPNGNVLVAGGFANGAYLSSAELYVSTMAIWMPIRSMGTARGDHTATLLMNDEVLVTGGSNAGGVTSSAELLRLDTFGAALTLSWTPATTMPTIGGRAINGRSGHTASLLRDGRVLVAGGSDGFGEISGAMVFTAGGAGTWTPMTSLGLTGTGAGRDMVVSRLHHTANVLPDGRVLVIGGVTAAGSAIRAVEEFNVDISSWVPQPNLATGRGYHAATVLNNGNVLVVGGSPTPTTVTNVTESTYYGPVRDLNTPAGSVSRIPDIVSVDTGTVDRAGPITFVGNNFKGGGEASGGGAASANSSFHTPRFYIQGMGHGGGFVEDLSASIYTGTNPNWSVVHASVTANLPATAPLLPYGWYQARVTANAQFSNAFVVQAGPPKPTGTPGIPSPTVLDPATVLWSWTPAAGCPAAGICEGYHVYSATNSVFFSTVSATCPGGTCQYLQTGIPAGAVASIRVSPYNISGDGVPVISTASLVTTSLAIAGVVGTPQTTNSILWTWNAIPSALSFRVQSRSTGTYLAVPTTNSFLEVGLGTNTAQSIQVQAFDGVQYGPMTPSATTYTLADVPVFINPGVTAISTGGFTTHWGTGANPANTRYRVTTSSGATGPTVTVSTTTGNLHSVQNQTPNKSFQVRVAAVNGDNIATAEIITANLYTLASPPTVPAIIGNSLSTVILAWAANGNPTNTRYQVRASSDDFVTSVSTPVPFSDNHTTLSATVSGLITSQLYKFEIYARNEDSVETLPAVISTTTFNGGGPPGSIAAQIDNGQNTNMTGTIGSGRTVLARFIPNTFPGTPTVFISSRTTVSCGGVTVVPNGAISVTVNPEQQPVHPILLGISYSAAETVGFDLSRLTITRYDPSSGVCVPLSTSLDSNRMMLFAQTNHLSDFQIAQVNPSDSVNNIRIFPNPFNSSDQSYVTFDHLPASARVRVYTLRGNLVLDGEANAAGILTWGATNPNSRSVASGIYLVVVESNGQREVRKLAVVR
ncbi:MAG: T9SS type A sorting domain-containing protein [Elusimicrobia bacterium]|nr:T9SS type A sorting domain-containing protein [Elusimicrobiota bacterium]